MSSSHSKKNHAWDELEATLAPEAREAFARFREEYVAQPTDRSAFDRFRALLATHTAHLPGFDPKASAGPLFAAFKPKDAKVSAPVAELQDLAKSLPYPLGLKLLEVLRARRLREEGTPAPQEAFVVCAAMTVIVRLAALMAVRAYVESNTNDAIVNRNVVDGLQKPSDGTWLELARSLAKGQAGDQGHAWGRLVHTAFEAKPALPDDTKRVVGGVSAGVALGELVALRNKLAHGEFWTQEQLARAHALLEVAARGFAAFAKHRFVVRLGERVFALEGPAPTIVELEVEVPEGEPCLVATDGSLPVFSLSPLVRFRPSGNGDATVDFNELYFVNAGGQERLAYVGFRAASHLDGKSLGSYEAFKALLAKIPTPPLPADPRLDFSSLAAFHAPLFTGRQTVLAEIADHVRQAPTQYLVLRALAGMGKSAIAAVLLQATINHAAKATGTAVPCAGDAHVSPDDVWAFHFCGSNDGRNSPTVALRSLIAQLCDRFGMKRDDYLSGKLEELKDDYFPALVHACSGKLSDGQRLVIVIDALDEGFGAEKDSIAACIPAGTYPGVVFLLTYRVEPGKGNARVEKDLVQIGAERTTVLTHANPLAGLTREDVDVYLEKLESLRASDYRTTPDTREATWNAASAETNGTGADPFYLRLVAAGVQNGAIRLDRAETIPASLDDAFEEMWMGLPTDQNFLCHRILFLLAILREPGTDELVAEIIARDTGAELTPTDIAAARLKVGKLLVYEEDRYSLFHDRFKRFLVGDQPDPLAEVFEEG